MVGFNSVNITHRGHNFVNTESMKVAAKVIVCLISDLVGREDVAVPKHESCGLKIQYYLQDYRDLASISRGDSGYRDGEKSGGDHTREVVEMRRRQEMGGGRGKGGRALTQGRPMSTAEKANLVNK